MAFTPLDVLLVDAEEQTIRQLTGIGKEKNAARVQQCTKKPPSH